MIWKELFWVGAGGAAGSMARYLLSAFITRHHAAWFPWGTLAVNLLGCLLIGVLAALFERWQVAGGAWRLFFIVGICGGFTTFSTFASEALFLLRNGMYGLFALYAAGSFAGGLLLVYAGFRCAAGKI